MQRRLLLLMGLIALGAASAKDYSSDWKFMVILQPQFQFQDGRKPTFVWRRVRGIMGGPLSSTLKAKVHIDLAHERVDWLDYYVDWSPAKYPVAFNLTLGGQYPAWAHDGVTFPDTINYSYVVASTQLPLRNFGAQATLGFLSNYRLAMGIFNGVQKFDDNNDRPNYFASFTAVQPNFDARAWGLVGQDPNTAGTNTKTSLYGAELTNLRLGNWNGELAGIYGQRFGRQVAGGYAQLGYWFTKADVLYARYDCGELNLKTPGNWRQRVIGSYHHRFTPWFDSLWDVEYDTVNDNVSGWIRGDFRF